MKRNLLSSAIIIALMTLGATGCDDNNVKTEATPAASSQPATPAPSQTPETQSGESPAQPPAAKPETATQPPAASQKRQLSRRLTLKKFIVKNGCLYRLF